MSSYNIGILTGIIVAFIVLFIFYRKEKNLNKYDERQMMIRGRGYSYAFYVNLILGVLYGIFQEDFPVQIPPGIIIITILLISGMVLSTYLIFNDAYWGYKYYKFKTFFGFYIAMFMLNFIQVFNVIATKKVFVNGKLQFRNGLPIIVAVFFLYMAIILSIKAFLDRLNTDTDLEVQ